MNKLYILVYDEEFARLIKHIIDTLDSICINFKFTNKKKKLRKNLNKKLRDIALKKDILIGKSEAKIQSNHQIRQNLFL